MEQTIEELVQVANEENAAAEVALAQLKEWWEQVYVPATAQLPAGSRQEPCCPGVYSGGPWQYWTGYGHEVRETSGDHWLELVRETLEMAAEEARRTVAVCAAVQAQAE
jgi:hypothetical protein